MKPNIRAIAGFESRRFGVIVGDRITSKQHVAMKRNPWEDSDGDGVVNGLDCQPRNKRRHSVWPATQYEQQVELEKSYRFFGNKGRENEINKYLQYRLVKKPENEE